MKRRIKQVLPTAPSPTRQILTFIFWRSMGFLRPAAPLARGSHYKGIAYRLSLEITRLMGPEFPGCAQASPPRAIASARTLNASLTPWPDFADAKNCGALWIVPIRA